MDYSEYIPDSIPRDIPSGELVERTLLFGDVSGFTALSEKLADAGKKGSEELTDILNDYFSTMIDIICSEGGDIITFGGDALFTAFEEPGSALNCAVKMQEAMEEFGEVESSVGTHPLEMSIGLSRGEVLYSTLGNTDRAAFGMFGDTVNRVEGVESMAESGEITLDSNVKENLALDEYTSESGGFFALTGDPDIHSEKTEPVEPGQINPEPFLHNRLIERLKGGLETGEHRQVTVIFLKFEGLNKLIKESTVTASEKLNDFFLECSEIVEDYDGFLSKIDIAGEGYKMMIVFGAPHSHENDGERAYLAALDISNIDIPFQLKMGINTGFVFAGFVGAEERREYTVMGDAVNTAARLMANSESGNILVRQSIKDFEYDELEPIDVKGKSKTLNVFRLKEKIETGTINTGETPLYGRDSELRNLCETFREVKEGRGAIVTVEGDPGIGKTRLLEELVSETREESTVLAGECRSHRSKVRYHPWREIFKQLYHPSEEDFKTFIERIDPSFIQWLPLAGELFDRAIEDNPFTKNLDAESRKRITGDIALKVLEYFSKENPLLLILDSLQWIDEHSGELIKYLRDNMGSSSILIILSGRTVDINTEKRLELESLDDEYIKELSRFLLDGNPLHRDAAGMLVDRSEGNPLFLEEMLEVLLDEERIYYDDHLEEYRLSSEMGETDVPDNLNGIVMARVDGLRERERNCLQMASVIGTAFRREMIEELADKRIDEELKVLTENNFLSPRDKSGYEFSQPLFRETVYESMSYTKKREYHKQVAEYIESKERERSELDYLQSLAVHYYRAEVKDKAVRFLRKSGEIARGQADYPLAIDSFSKINEISDEDTEQKAHALLKLGMSYRFLGELDKGRKYFEEGKELKVSKFDSNFNYWLGEIYRLRNKFEKAQDLFDKINEGDIYPHSRGSMGLIEAMKGDMDAARKHLKDAKQSFEKNNQREAVAHALNNLAGIEKHLGNMEKAGELMDRSIEIFEDLGNLRGLCDLNYSKGSLLYSRGDLNEAISYYDRALELSEKIKHLNRSAAILTDIGLINIERADYEEARVNFGRAIKTAKKVGSKNQEALALLNLAQVNFLEGQVGDALGNLKESYNLSEETSNSVHLVYNCIRFVNIFLEINNPDRAKKYLDEMEEIIEEQGIKQSQVFLYLLRGRYHLLSGDYQKVRELLNRAEKLAEERGQKAELGEILLVRARLEYKEESIEKAKDCLNRAKNIAERIDSITLKEECIPLELLLECRESCKVREVGNAIVSWKCRWAMAQKSTGEESLEYARGALKEIMNIASGIGDKELMENYLNSKEISAVKDYIQGLE